MRHKMARAQTFVQSESIRWEEIYTHDQGMDQDKGTYGCTQSYHLLYKGKPISLNHRANLHVSPIGLTINLYLIMVHGK